VGFSRQIASQSCGPFPAGFSVIVFFLLFFYNGFFKVECCAISPDSTQLVTASSDGIVRLWDMIAAQHLGTPPPHKTEVIFLSPFS
jgi:WD40 repeat protein